MAESKTEAKKLREKLMRIQVELKAPKNLRNSFGNYNYRNAEGILEALKPYEKTYNVVTTLSDTMEVVGDRVYVKATATIIDTETGEEINVTAYAREAESKKGMDDAQVTGATSSYARKYALNGLFLLDDTKDMDSDEYQNQTAAAKSPYEKKSTNSTKDKTKQAYAELIQFCHDNNLDINEVVATCRLTKESKCEDFEEALTYAKSLIGRW